MTPASPPVIRTQRVYPSAPSKPAARPEAAANLDVSPRLMAGLFANGHELLNWSLGTLVFVGLFLNNKFGSLAILVFLGATALLGVRYPAQSVKDICRAWPLLLYPVLAVASFVWSNYPDVTMRGGIQLLLTMLAAILMATRLSPRQFISALFLGSLITCLGCIAFPSYADSTDGVAFVGIMGSKNMLSFLAGTLVLTSLNILVDSKHLAFVRLFAITGIAIGFGLVLAAKSAGGLIDSIVGCGIFTFLLFTIRLRQSARAFLLASAIILASPAIIMAPVIKKAADNFIIEVLHKDPTLTGRTYLWDRARQIVAERPLLGVGYNGFWVQGESDAEGLWAYAGITNRTGFNFHNQYMDVLVALGWTGLAFLVAALLSTVMGVGFQALLTPTIAGSFFLSNTVVNLIRSFTESSLIQEFNFYSLVLFAGGVFGWRALRAYREQALAQPAAEDPLRQKASVGRQRPHRPTRQLRRAPARS